MPFNNKLERLSPASLSSLVYCLWVSLELAQMKHLSGAPLQSMLLALPANIRLGRGGLPWTYALAYYEKLKLTAVNSFITLAPWSGSLARIQD